MTAYYTLNPKPLTLNPTLKRIPKATCPLCLRSRSPQSWSTKTRHPSITLFHFYLGVSSVKLNIWKRCTFIVKGFLWNLEEALASWRRALSASVVLRVLPKLNHSFFPKYSLYDSYLRGVQTSNPTTHSKPEALSPKFPRALKPETLKSVQAQCAETNCVATRA